MPSTVIYRTGYPSTAAPAETSAEIASDGLVTGSAVFIVSDGSTVFPLNQPISQVFFSALRNVNLQGLFVESRSLEKRNGIHYLRLGVVGALNPPVFVTRRSSSPRSISKSLESDDGAVSTFSFDYQAETFSVSAILTRSTGLAIPVPTPKVLNIWNQRGQGFIERRQETGRFDSPELGVIVVRPRILTTEDLEERAGIVRFTRTSQFVYE